MRRTAFFLVLATSVASPLHATDAADVQTMALKELPQITAWRRDIHQHPELSNREVRTGALLATELKKLRLEVHTGSAHIGAVGSLNGDLPDPRLAIRADMDAVPVKERLDLPFASMAPFNHSPKLFLDKGALAISIESMPQASLDYLDGSAT